MYAVRGNSAHNKAGHDHGALDQIRAVVLDNECMQKLSQGSPWLHRGRQSAAYCCE